MRSGSTARPDRWRRAPAHLRRGQRTPSGATEWACVLGDRPRPLPRSMPRAALGSGPTGPTRIVPAWPPSVVRTLPVSTGRCSPRSAGSGSRRVRTDRGTSPAGSPCLSSRASARTSRRSLPPSLSPTMLSGLAPSAPPHTISRHFMPFPTTRQPPPGNRNPNATWTGRAGRARGTMHSPPGSWR